MRLVFFDLETGGLDPLKHPIIQIAAIAVDEQLQPLDEFEAKIAFDLSRADGEALAKNCYDEETWDREAKPAGDVCVDFQYFLKRYADVRMVSQRTGQPYQVAQLIGHNAATFDGPFIQQLYKQHSVFFPASYRVLCTLQRVQFMFLESGWKPPTDFKLSTLCEHFGVKLEGAHDALQDVRGTLGVYQSIRNLCGTWIVPKAVEA